MLDNNQDKKEGFQCAEQCRKSGSTHNQASAIAKDKEGQECKLLMKNSSDLRCYKVEKSKAVVRQAAFTNKRLEMKDCDVGGFQNDGESRSLQFED